MIPIDQTKYHTNGNCFEAALASILELPLSDVPDFGKMGEKWWPRFYRWIESMGFSIVTWSEEVELPGYYLVMGTSPRDPAVNHQVIYQAGRLAHDPHPDRTGVVDVKEVMALVPFDPARHTKE